MEIKLKLANSILIEIEALRECQTITGCLNIAECMTRDALQLAEIIKQEETERKVA